MLALNRRESFKQFSRIKSKDTTDNFLLVTKVVVEVTRTDLDVVSNMIGRNTTLTVLIKKL